MIDYDNIERKEKNIQTIKIGEILQLIIYIILIFMPLFRIPEFMELINNKRELIVEIIKSFSISLVSLFLLYKLNPLDIKDKIKKLANRKKS